MVDDIKWKMQGIEVNLDTSIGKWMSKLADTVTRLAEIQNKNNEVEPGCFVYLISGGFSIQFFSAITAMWTEQEIKKLKQDLKFFKETGGIMRINLTRRTNQRPPKYSDSDLIFAHKTNLLRSLISLSQHQKAFDPTFSSLTGTHAPNPQITASSV